MPTQGHIQAHVPTGKRKKDTMALQDHEFVYSCTPRNARVLSGQQIPAAGPSVAHKSHQLRPENFSHSANSSELQSRLNGCIRGGSLLLQAPYQHQTMGRCKHWTRTYDSNKYPFLTQQTCLSGPAFRAATVCEWMSLPPSAPTASLHRYPYQKQE